MAGSIISVVGYFSILLFHYNELEATCHYNEKHKPKEEEEAQK
jgi:hypothetical protein